MSYHPASTASILKVYSKSSYGALIDVVLKSTLAMARSSMRNEIGGDVPIALIARTEPLPVGLGSCESLVHAEMMKTATRQLDSVRKRLIQ